MKNHLLLIVVFLLCSNFGLGQTKRIDSLKQLVHFEQSDTLKISHCLQIAKEYLSVNIDSLHLYNEQALKLSLKNDDYLLARIYNNKGLVFIYNSKADSARYYLDKSLKILEIKEDPRLKGVLFGNYAMSYQVDGDLENMGKYNLLAIEASKGDDKELCRLYFNQGIIYGHSELLDDSKKYFKLAFNKSVEVENFAFEALSAKGLGHIYMNEKKVDSAKTYLERSVYLCDKIKDAQVCYEANSKIGQLYDLMDKPEKAEIAFKKARQYAEQRNSKYELMAINIFLGQHELKKKNFAKAVEYFNEFEKFYLDNPQPGLRVENLKSWAKAEEGVGNFEKSTLLLEEYVQLKDSLYSVENRQVLTNAEAKYQSEKKDKEIAEQKLALTESKSKTQTMNILIVSLLLGSILLWFSFRQRQKRMQQQLVAIEKEQEVRTLESLMLGEEKERLRIAKELHDGVNGDLAAIKFKLTSLLETNNQVINEAVAMLDTSSEQVRAISHNLVPPSLRDFDLLEAISSYCENMNAIHDPEIIFQHLGNDIILEKKQEANLFRIVQELVTNSIKHAEAKEIHVQLSNIEGNLQLTVEDDGKGFDVANVKSDGIGMQNIKSRVEYLGGLMDMKSDAKGSSFTITIADKPEKT